MIVQLIRRARATVAILVTFAMAIVSVPALAVDANIEMITTGTGAKQELRFQPQVGSTQTVDFIMKMSMEMSGPMPMKMDLPGMKLGMRTAVTSVAPNGDITYSLEIIDSGVMGEGGDPNARAMMEQQVKTMVGTKATITVDNMGYTKNADFQPPAGAPPELVANLQKSMDGSSAPLPSEAVGVGAKWKLSQNVEENGLNVKQTAIYEVTKLTADSVVLTLAIDQTATPGPIDDPKLPPGAVANLDKLAGNGKGTTTLAFGHPMVMDADLDLVIKTTMTMSMKADPAMGIPTDQSQTIDMSMGMATQVKRR